MIIMNLGFNSAKFLPKKFLEILDATTISSIPQGTEQAEFVFASVNLVTTNSRK